MGSPFIDFLYFVRFGARPVRHRTWVTVPGVGSPWREEEATVEGRRKAQKADWRVLNIVSSA